ncbi:hypothetical protein AWM70_05090 [Paenibacillus yonginensis]|uniref:Uncharacterized protein n=1 Tax=Paenibacillus yonginensis TaxID=1462996 RepID=A0A1B1MXW2_9BACL|nr:hypothetical protein [Paenibacillus yonginensis]ANS74022.1 hypothetical protein AWM70_05090 [Paenibacillus yonginensis]
MAGKMLFNWLFGGVGLILTFLVSSSHNLFITSLIRSLIAFVIWFLLAFAIRWMLGLSKADPVSLEERASGSEEAEKGLRVDLTTPDEQEAINDMLKPSGTKASENSQGTAAFEPLKPPRLVKTADRDPEELAKAVRHLTED